MRNRFKYNMNSLEVLTKRNIYDYLARPKEKYDKEYSKEGQEIRKYIRKDDLETKSIHSSNTKSLKKYPLVVNLLSKSSYIISL